MAKEIKYGAEARAAFRNDSPKSRFVEATI